MLRRSHSRGLGQNVRLILCFSPINELFQTYWPVAWKYVARLPIIFCFSLRNPPHFSQNSADSTSFTAKYAPNLGVSVAQIDCGSLVDAGIYNPITVGQQMDLTLNNKTRPPVFNFSMSSLANSPSPSRLTIMIQGAPFFRRWHAHSFITDLDNTAQESMNTMFVVRNVDDGLATGNFTPALRVYIDLDYEEGQLLRQDILDNRPIWQGDIRQLQSSTVIAVAPNQKGGFSATVLDASNNVPLPPDIFTLNQTENTAIYVVELAFATADLVTKVAYKDGSADAVFELILPIGTSWISAKWLRNGKDCTYWTDVGPATASWVTMPN
ncbi:hypothetical protein A0H81_14601 [Grifola frondosa]|uniref:Uncharacterized protein n=1 Tax=Grifola frondosa TaxID=5627 RepID=A0A1C7LN69_GRIFR|nr:hypothetical protein A0H81_14601 [Grifola frondosa]